MRNKQQSGADAVDVYRPLLLPLLLLLLLLLLLPLLHDVLFTRSIRR